MTLSAKAARQVLVIHFDALPYHLLGAYGGQWVETPRLDQLAHRGIVFDHCYLERPETGAWLATCAYQQSLLVRDFALDDSVLGRSLSALGIPSALFSDRPGWDRPFDYPSLFAEFHSFAPDFGDPDSDHLGDEKTQVGPGDRAQLAACGHRLPPEGIPEREVWLRRWRRLQQQVADPTHVPSIERLFAGAGDWLVRHRSDACFAWVDVALECGNWAVQPSWIEPYLEGDNHPPIPDPMPHLIGGMYEEEDLPGIRAWQGGRVAYVDSVIGQLVDRLAEAGMLDQVLLVVTADRGVPMGEHDLIGPMLPFAYEERTHVPLLVVAPAGRRAVRSLALVQGADLAHALAEFFGLEAPAIPASSSLLQITDGRRTMLRDYLIQEVDGAEYSLRTQQWKLILPLEPDEDGNPPRARELYSKPEDRWDVNNLAEMYIDAADQLELQLLRTLEAYSRGTVAALPPLRESVLMQRE